MRGESTSPVSPLSSIRHRRSLPRAWFPWALLVTACLLVRPSLATEPVSAPEVISLLQKVQLAARDTDYSGVFIYQEGVTMQSSRVVHVVDGTGERERLELLDGAPREFIRHNETVQCLIPDKKLVIVEKGRSDRFPGLLLGDGKNLANFYNFAIDNTATRIAGRECTVVNISPKDPHRYAYRLCIDKKTNLLVKAQTLDGEHVIDQISFSTLQVGEHVSADLLTSQWDTRDWTTFQTPTSEINVAKLGWRITPPPGYEFITQISRPMKSGKAVKQMVLSDGLSAISVFIEPYDTVKDARVARQGPSRTGAINIFSSRIGAHWLTAIGEVPPDTLRTLAEGTQYLPAVSTPE